MKLKRRPISDITVLELGDNTTVNSLGAVQSTQVAVLKLPAAKLASIWSPMYLERLARTYWRYLTRISLGLIKVIYTDQERRIVLLSKRLPLLCFHAPEYTLTGDTSFVLWRIKSGILAANKAGESGYLKITVQRDRPDENGQTLAHVEVEVANFYPSIAHSIGTWFYRVTQAKIHVIFTHSFLRSLARLDLVKSRVGTLER